MPEKQCTTCGGDLQTCSRCQRDVCHEPHGPGCIPENRPPAQVIPEREESGAGD